MEFFSQLPGNSLAVGTISIFQLIALYSLIGLVCLLRWWQKRWWFAGIIAVCFIIIPVWQVQANLFRVTVLSTTGDPVMVIQDRGQVTLVNSGDENIARFTIVPFLQQHGINHIDWGIAVASQPKDQSSWSQILNRISVKEIYTNAQLVSGSKVKQQPLSVAQKIAMGENEIKLINPDPIALQFYIGNQTWLLLGNSSSTEQKQISAKYLPPSDILWWSGDSLKPEVLAAINPKVAIASSATIDPDTADVLSKAKTKVYWTGRDGALQWTPVDGFETMLESPEKDASML